MPLPEDGAAERDVVGDLAKDGRLRAAINYGNPMLAQRGPRPDQPQGVSAELSRELARRLDVPIAFVSFESAGATFASRAAGSWDVCFLAAEPERTRELDFTDPYVTLEGVFLVPRDSSLMTPADIDREDIEVVVGRGSACDLHLSRTLSKASLRREATSAKAIEHCLEDSFDVLGGVRQQIEAAVIGNPDVRLIDGRFMAIEQAMAMPRNRPAGYRFLRSFVDEMKASGFIRRVLGDREWTP